MTSLTAAQGVTIVPVLDEGLGNQSYVVALGDGRALVLDPSRDPLPYLRMAEDLGLQITFAVETHLHADFVSGSRELAAQGATILAPRAAELQAVYHGLDDGSEVDLGGGFKLRALATPGHTPEHLAYLLLNDGIPLALFSGGALIPGGTARTDLIDREQTEPLARALYRSIRKPLAELPDDLTVYPTHGGGSYCSAGARGERTTTLGLERQVNPLLTTEDEDTFIRGFLGGLGSYPAYFRRLRAVNRSGARLYGVALPELPRLSAWDVQQQLTAATTLIDARPYPEFATGHIPGAVSIALRPAFGSWLGWVVPADRRLLFALGPEQDRRDLVSQCLKVGYEDLVGEVDGGMAAWRALRLPESSVALRRVEDDLGQKLLDVRQTAEWDAGHLPRAQHVELGSIKDSNGKIPAGPLTIYCGHGERAMTAASLLEATGHRGLAVLDGGFAAWSDAGQPVTKR
jgi:glyoxylase-like metal-dependent hydrolase (beta-lactamase superfamily II)/rhodanese-related sulfurtransferase